MGSAEIKNNLEKVINECFKKASEKKFKDLNFSFPKNKTPKEFLKLKIKTLYNIDEYSKVFLSIHTCAKSALREFKQNKFEGKYLDLLRLVLTLSEVLNRPGFKSIRVYDKNELDTLSLGADITIIDEFPDLSEKQPYLKNTKIIGAGRTGKSVGKERVRLKRQINELSKIEF